MNVWLEHYGLRFRELWNANTNELKQNAILASQGGKSWDDVYRQIEDLLKDSKDAFEAWVREQAH